VKGGGGYGRITFIIDTSGGGELRIIQRIIKQPFRR
jgi:hypothetical protein